MRLAILCFLLWALPMPYVVAQGLADSTSNINDTKHGLVVISDIIITGNKLTKERIILREISVAKGDKVNVSSLDSLAVINKARLINLPLFTLAEVKFHLGVASNVIMHIEVKERWYVIPEISLKLADRNFNVWWYEQQHNLRRINVGVDLKHSNMFGTMQQLGVLLQGGYTQRLGIIYQNPYIDRKQQQGIGAMVVYSRSQEMPFNTIDNKLAFARSENIYVNKVLDAEVYYTYRPAYATRHLGKLSYKYFQIADTIATLHTDYFNDAKTQAAYLSLGYRIDINRVNNWNYPLTGEKVVGAVSQKVGLGSRLSQTQLQLEAGKFLEPWPKWFVSGVFRGRLSFPVNQPYYLRTAMGYGNEYLRGYEYYVIDGSHYAIGKLMLRREVFNRTIKKIPLRYLPELPIRLYPKVYAELGYGYNSQPGTSTLNNQLLRSVGFGLDIVTAYDIKLKLEVSWNHLGERGIYFHQRGD